MERKPDDQQWVRRLKSDGPERDQALEELRSVMLRGLSRSLDGRYGERFNAEDVVQDALMKVLNSLDKFEGRSRFTTWAMAIATRVGISSLRRKHFKDVSLDAISAEGEARIEIAVDEAQTPDNQLDQSAILSKLKEMIANLLTDKQRTAIRGMLEGMPVEVIAERTGSNRNAVYKLVHDARMRLREGFLAAGIAAEDVSTIFS